MLVRRLLLNANPRIQAVTPRSRLVICQLDLAGARAAGYSKRWKMNGGLYEPFYREAKALYDSVADRITMRWIPREENGICDVLSKKVLLDMGVVFRIQPETD